MAEQGYSDFDRQRFLQEDRRAGTNRGEFTRDRARVLHSAALRRLGAKTQVLSPAAGGNNDFARTRLTHSLEVAQIGREMAADLGLDPDIVDLACLAHDLGHPPFGHNGEKALNAWALEIGGFEGNAQTLRLLSRIEPKVFGLDGRPFGLNLTRAALDAAIKYPWSRAEAAQSNPGMVDLKFGYYEDDAPIFEWVRVGAPQYQKSVEAQVMDFSDDVAYSVHDFEDAIVSGFIILEELANPANEAQLIAQIFDWAGGKFTVLQLTQALHRLRKNPYWSDSFANSQSELGRLKNLTSSLIGSFVQRTTSASFSWAQEGEITRFNSQLQVPAEVAEEIAVLKGTVAAFLMTHESRRPVYEWQRALLIELCDALLAANGKHLDSFATAAWLAASDEVGRKRAVVDHVACLTDQSAISQHHQLVTKAGR
jgi:dGTPase